MQQKYATPAKKAYLVGFEFTTFSPRSRYDETNLRPTIPDTITSKHIILMTSRDSPNRNMPNIATPTAPMPVHTAYAVPIGIVFMAAESNHKLIAMADTVKSDGTGFVKPSVYLSPIAHPHSNKPATTK
jgi:hypothetical protein